MLIAVAGKHCFVIMPFSTTVAKHTTEYWDKFFSNFITPPVENLVYTLRRRMKVEKSNNVDALPDVGACSISCTCFDLIYYS
jgi:hypothetical protein